jgi:RimJ/RimL family protein N-acetyltransferase
VALQEAQEHALKYDDLQLETERLILRLQRPEDFDGYAELQADPEASRYIGGVLTRAAAWRKFLQMPGAWMIQGYAMFSVVEKASGEWIGNVGPWQPEGWPGTEIGWAFRRCAWGRGIAFEAATAAVDWAFAQLGWTRMIHSIVPENQASQKLARRLGSRLIGPGHLPAPFEHVAIEIWEQTATQWRAHRGSLPTESFGIGT